MDKFSKLNRRDFLKATGFGAAGFAMQATISADADAAKPISAMSLSSTNTLSLNVFVHIAKNDRVTIIAHRSEMGQGIRTGLPQIVADELDADWDKVDILQAEANEKYGNQNTDGSNSVRSFYHAMREMGAFAKLMLRQAAAAQWQAPLEFCIAKNHRVTHAATGKVFSYGELALAAAKLPIPDKKTIQLKSPNEFKYIGKPISIVDMEDILNGNTQFGIDVAIPDMVHASIERCPFLGGKVKSFDATKALKLPGVLNVIKIDGGIEPAHFNPLAGIAVVATNTWAAMQGRKALVIEWEASEHSTYNSVATMTELANKELSDEKIVRVQGDIENAFSEAFKTHEATYTTPHLEHVTLEPPTATALVKNNKCEIWACVQDPITTRNFVASLLGFSPQQVTVNITLIGGGFGRKSKPDFVAEAALLAKRVGKPVKVTWTREDTFRHGYYHAFSVQNFKAALDKKHNLIGLDSQVASPSIVSIFKPNISGLQNGELGQGFIRTPYAIPNLRVRNLPTVAHTRIGWLRSVYNYNHAFAVNSFIDELARLGKRDPLEYQIMAIGEDRIEKEIQNLDTARLKNVLNVVKKSTNWPSKTKKFEGWGVAVHRSFMSYVAVASKVSIVDKKLRVMEVHLAIDCGQIVNPDRVKSQMEGSVIFGLSAALLGEITFNHGVVQQSSFDNFELLRMHQCPKIVISLIENDEKHGGVGEPGVPPVAPSIVNAIVAAGGPRIRNLPIKNTLAIA